MYVLFLNLAFLNDISQGSPSTSSAICRDFWLSDSRYFSRQAILDKSLFPHDAISLPRLLATLAGNKPEETGDDFSQDTSAAKVYEYFSYLPSLTFATNPSCCRFVSNDSQGRKSIESTKDLILPGGAKILRGTRGTLLSGEEGESRVITWQAEISGWALLLEVLRAGAGLRGIDEWSGHTPAAADFVHMSVGDLGLDGDPSAIAIAGLKLLRAVLQCSYITAAGFLDAISLGDSEADLILLRLALAILDNTRTSLNSALPNLESAILAVGVIQALLRLSPPHLCSALRASAFFSVPGRTRSTSSALIQAESTRGDHSFTLAVLRLASSITAAPSRDDGLVISALHLLFTEVWSQYLGWRFQDVASKYELASTLLSIFDSVLRHPLESKSLGPTGAAKHLIDTFIYSASPIIYRPLSDNLSQLGVTTRKLVASSHQQDAELVVTACEASMDFTATLLRVATMLGISANALPMRFLVAPVQLIDTLFDLALAASTQGSTKMTIIQLLLTWLEAISTDPQRISLAGSLKNADKTFQALGRLTIGTYPPDVRTSIWRLLGTIISTQPGCASFCIGSIGDEVSGTLSIAVKQITAFDSIIIKAPQALAAVLKYVQSVFACPGARKAVDSLRKDQDFWQAVFDISTYLVPVPPTFTLSMHSEDFAFRIRQYAYTVQAKANATALLASELSLTLDDDQGAETKAQSLVLSLFRNGSMLEEAGVSAVHSSCSPDLHETAAKKLAVFGTSLPALKTIYFPGERDFGRTYLYGQYWPT